MRFSVRAARLWRQSEEQSGDRFDILDKFKTRHGLEMRRLPGYDELLSERGMACRAAGHSPCKMRIACRLTPVLSTSPFWARLQEGHMFDQESAASQVKADRFPFPARGRHHAGSSQQRLLARAGHVAPGYEARLGHPGAYSRACRRGALHHRS